MRGNNRKKLLKTGSLFLFLFFFQSVGGKDYEEVILVLLSKILPAASLLNPPFCAPPSLSIFYRSHNLLDIWSFTVQLLCNIPAKDFDF